MKVTFSKKVQTSQYEPVFYMADLTPEDLSIPPISDPEALAMVHMVLSSMARKFVYDAMRKALHVSEEEYAEQFPTFLTPDQIDQILSAVKES